MTQLPEQQSGDSPLTNSQSIQHETRRIGIILGDMGKVNLPALKFLVLQLNILQHTFEYEFLPTDPDDSFLKELSYQAIATLMEIEEKAPHFLRRYVKKLHQQINDYQLEETPPDLFILVTMACFSEDYYSTRLTLSHGLAILALGNWKRSMAPPSLLEFIFTGIIGESVALVSPKIVQSIHYGTKGCLFDFASSLDEVRLRVLSGFICSQCRATLQSDGLAKLADELDPILRKD